MSEWTSLPIRECLVSHFAGEWGDDPNPANVRVLRATNVSDEMTVDLEGGAHRKITAKKLDEKQLLSGDIILEASGGSADKPVGRVAFFEAELTQKFVVSNFFRTLRPNTSVVDPKFFCLLLHWFYAQQPIKAMQQQTTGIINLKLEQYLGYPVDIPVYVTEQKTISNILDTLDTQIRQTEAIIAKLQQVKQGLLHDLLTRGIDANGQLRPPRDQAPELYSKFSQGYFPGEWKEIQLGNMADIVSGVTVGGSGGKSRNVSVPYLRVANVQDGYLDLSEVKTITVSAEEKERYILQYGDVLMNEGGDFDKLGRGTVWEQQIEECIHQNHVFRVRVNRELLSPFFLAYWSGSHYGKKYFVLSSKQSTNLASINSTQLKAYPIMVPPAAEQQEIEDRVNSINSKMGWYQRESEKLRKQKSGLMDDLLTGRVRVTSLPDTAKAS